MTTGYATCQWCSVLYSSDGSCPNCTELRMCRCGLGFYVKRGQYTPCPRCVPEFYAFMDGNGGVFIKVVVNGDNNSLIVNANGGNGADYQERN